MEIPFKFDQCFPQSTRSMKYFISYASILERFSSKEPDRTHLEKHHIVPREWLKCRFEDFNFDSEDPRNVVYLSVRDKLMAYQYLALYFLELKDSRTYSNLVDTITRRYHLGKYQFWKNPYLDRETVSFLVEKRKQELKRRKVRYSDEYLLRCRELMESAKSPDEGFELVRKEMGFKFSKAALIGQLTRRFGKCSK